MPAIEITRTELTSFFYAFVTYIVTSVGYYGLFRKCGRPLVYAFIPVIRDYQLAIGRIGKNRGARTAS